MSGVVVKGLTSLLFFAALPAYEAEFIPFFSWGDKKNKEKDGELCPKKTPSSFDID